MNKFNKYMRIARKEAAKSNDEFQFGAVLVVGKNIVSKGYNRGSKTHPIQARMYPERIGTGLHAEIDTLRGLRPYDAAGGELFVIRLKPDNTIGSAKPCGKCLEIIDSFDIKRIFYSLAQIGDDFVYCEEIRL